MENSDGHSNVAKQPASAGALGDAPLHVEIGKLMDLWQHYGLVRMQQVRLAIRRAIWRTLLLLAAVVAGLAALIASIAMMLGGVAGGLAEAGLPLWSARLIVGAGTLLLIAAAFVGVNTWRQHVLIAAALRDIRARQRTKTPDA